MLISCAVTAQLILVFVFAYAKFRFSHNEAQLSPVTSQLWIFDHGGFNQLRCAHTKKILCVLGHRFFIFCFTNFFRNKLYRVGGRTKNKSKIRSDHFPIELKSKETQFLVSFDFDSIGKWSE